jgi:predicted acylesterase/phospholipase RssA
LSVVFGGGGNFGLGFNLGVADSLIEAGIRLELPNVPKQGLSAGAFAAACLATGRTIDALTALPRLRIPNLKRGYLQGITRDLFGGGHANDITTIATQIHPLRPHHRVVLHAAEHALSDIVAASSAVPGMRPVEIGGRYYLDGGSLSSYTKANKAPAADHLLVVAPVAGPVLGRFGRWLERSARREMSVWKRRTGGNAILIQPDDATAGLLKKITDIFDVGLTGDAYHLARARTTALIASQSGMKALMTELRA